MNLLPCPFSDHHQGVQKSRRNPEFEGINISEKKDTQKNKPEKWALEVK